MTYAYLKGQFVPVDQAKISIQNNTFQYGTGIFEGIRAYWNPQGRQLYVFRLVEHFCRMLRNCRVLKLNIGKDEKELSEIATELLRKNHPETDTYIRPIAYVDSDGLGPKFVGYPTGFAMYTIPLGDYIDVSSGIKVGFSSWRRINDNTIPARCKVTGGYVNSALAKTEALEHGYDEAIFLTENGFISEGSAENIFLIRGGKLITPALSEDILEGITRETIIELAREELGIETVERPIGRTELYVADEAFLCGTGAQVSPMIEVDKRPLGNGRIGPITAKIQALYFDVVKGKQKKYSHWLAPVY
ncbi:MAG: branched-chain amino acid transaminase [candidate division NC10 bacterium]|nr:branched-chain amino acid transaminase [candidate division NC10 bacterium]